MLSSSMAMDMSPSATRSAMSMSATGSINSTDLPLSDPSCNSDTCLAYKTAHDASQAQISWASQFEYGHWTTYYYCIFIFLFGLAYLSRRLGPEKVVLQESKTTATQKSRAIWRSLFYRKLGIGMSMGMATFIGLAVLFLTIMSFVQKPYYRLHRGFGSPPLGVRTGLMAIALTPIIVALSGKYNVVTLITGISHERLNVLHRYVGYICLALSVVHTIPFIVAPLKDGGYAALYTQFYQPGGYEYTGVPPLALLIFLCLFSVPWIRHRFYESFVHSHIIAYVVYLGLMFWHAGMALDSWNYLWATIAVWLFSLFGRIIAKFKSPTIKGAEAILQDIDGELVKITIPTFGGLSWKPGQHVFLRFPTIAPFDNHPFTIASDCDETYVTGKEGQTTRTAMVFLVKPYDGITKKLMKLAQSQENRPVTLRTFIEGPYGGLNKQLELSYEQLILVAGGSGITAVLPLLVSLSRKIKKPNSALMEIKLIWAVKTRSAMGWVQKELKSALDTAPEGTVTIDYYITTENQSRSNSTSGPEDVENGLQALQADEKLVQVHDKHHGLEPGFYGRPRLGNIIPSSLKLARAFVVGCGPKGMNQDLGNAVAASQAMVRRGEIQEVALHTETFGW